MKRLVASKAKQGEATKYCDMWALVAIPSHLGRGGKARIVGRLIGV
jgi:hypothetical protein